MVTSLKRNVIGRHGFSVRQPARPYRGRRPLIQRRSQEKPNSKVLIWVGRIITLCATSVLLFGTFFIWWSRNFFQRVEAYHASFLQQEQKYATMDRATLESVFRERFAQALEIRDEGRKHPERHIDVTKKNCLFCYAEILPDDLSKIEGLTMEREWFLEEIRFIDYLIARHENHVIGTLSGEEFTFEDHRHESHSPR